MSAMSSYLPNKISHRGLSSSTFRSLPLRPLASSIALSLQKLVTRLVQGLDAFKLSSTFFYLKRRRLREKLICAFQILRNHVNLSLKETFKRLPREEHHRLRSIFLHCSARVQRRQNWSTSMSISCISKPVLTVVTQSTQCKTHSSRRDFADPNHTQRPQKCFFLVKR